MEKLFAEKESWKTFLFKSSSMRFMINQSLNGTEIAFNVDAVSSPIEIGTVDAEQMIVWSK